MKDVSTTVAAPPYIQLSPGVFLGENTKQRLSHADVAAC